MEKKIIISVSPVGAVTLDAQGFVGGTCKDATRALEQVFAGGESDVTVKPEMHQISYETSGEEHEQERN